MRALVAALLFAVVGAFYATTPAAAEDPVLVDMEVLLADRTTVGDCVSYIVEIESEPGVQFSVVQASLPVIVDLVDLPVSTTRPVGDGRVLIRLTFQLAAFAPGEIEVPPITLRYFGPEVVGGELRTQASQFTVVSVLPPEPLIPTPRDLKPQAVIDKPPVGWVVPAMAASAAILALVGLSFSVRRRVLQLHGVKVLTPVQQEELPEDRARIVLDTTGASFGLEGDYVEYYSSIGVTMRQYLTERYGFPAFALTTRELEAEMLKRGLDRWQVRVASGLLEQCDSVVYANYRPAGERADADLTAAYEIVEMSRPEPASRPEQEQEEAAPR